MQMNRRLGASGRTAVFLTVASLGVLALAGVAILRASAFYAQAEEISGIQAEAGPPEMPIRPVRASSISIGRRIK